MWLVIVADAGIGVAILAHHWHSVSPHPVLVMFFLVMIGVGAFQVWLAANALQRGSVRYTYSRGLNSIAPTSLFPLLFMPSGPEYTRADSPVTYWMVTGGRLLIGVMLTTIPGWMAFAAKI